MRKTGPRLGKVLTTEALVFDRRRKSYETYYNTCCGIGNISFTPTEVSGPVGTGDQLRIFGRWCFGLQEELTGSGVYSSDNSFIASVNIGGAASLNSVGNTNLNSSVEYWGSGVDFCVLAIAAAATAALVDSGSPPTASVSCTPSPLARGQTITCTASVQNAPAGATIAFEQWKFTSGSVTVNRNCTSCPATWSGSMVTSGNISVMARVNGNLLPDPATTTVTVNNRNWHTSPAAATQVPNGTIPGGLLPVPPQPNPPDSGLGISEEQTGHQGFGITVLGDNGPNHGFAYYASLPVFSPLFFRYTINPDLENSSSVFSQHQCGNYNASSNPSGFISWTNLITQTRRHEYNSLVQSHHAFYKNSINLTSNNPGDFVESRVALPGTDLTQFNGATGSGLSSRYAQILSATQVEPFPVNYSQAGVPLGNINYSPYVSCN